MEKSILLLFLFGVQNVLLSQMPHLDFIGAGHDNLVTVTTSNSDGKKTVDGFPISNQDQLKDASRFLAQASFGADYSTIEMTAAMGYEAWLEEQFQLPQISVVEEMVNQATLYGEYEAGGGIWSPLFRSVWMTNNIVSPDLLRQRMAFVLSEIYVINDNTDLFEDFGQLLGNFYDILGQNSFGNYQNLLTDVSLSTSMGLFLSHFNNPKEDLVNNIHPDENYAREIMQLFSIGLWELNPNGTRKYDANGQFIPTYSNADIKEFAQVFTGLGSGTPNGVFGEFEEDDIVAAVVTPMKMYENFHDTSEKHLLNGVVLPANQSGMQDFNQTISHLANHQNTAPFISKSLIKFLTTSNPSGNYVQEVAAAFNPSEPNNFQKVITAILLHPEARTCEPTPDYTFGKLREPLVRYMNFLKAFQLSPNENGDFVTEIFCPYTSTGQSPLKAPSVFNFFLPEYSPQGPIGQNYMIAPEFQILNATNAIGLINEVNTRSVARQYLYDNCVEEPDFGEDIHYMDYSEPMSLINDSNALIDYLNILIANGLIKEDTKTIISDAINQLDNDEDKLKMALYLILISPDYAILK
jgi:uncharacterized protein (DUF1800 family)